MDAKCIAVPITVLRSMLRSMEADGDLHWCERCGAWLECDDEALATTGDFRGCWKAATAGDPRWDHLCRSERGSMLDELALLEKEAGITVQPGSIAARKE